MLLDYFNISLDISVLWIELSISRYSCVHHYIPCFILRHWYFDLRDYEIMVFVCFLMLHGKGPTCKSISRGFVHNKRMTIQLLDLCTIRIGTGRLEHRDEGGITCYNVVTHYAMTLGYDLCWGYFLNMSNY